MYADRAMLLLDETLSTTGSRRRVRIGPADDGALLLDVDGERLVLPLAALDAVMDRYGKPLDAAQAPTPDAPDAWLDLAGGTRLTVVSHRARYDVLPRAWLVVSRPGREPLAELSRAVAAALVHLARAAHASGRNSTG